ncbi:ABC transporter permease [Clostridium sp. LY3-2]|uniref:ABC transporter permease n=1 Tax=Clostridium sp. LY3-2 TaxID=2942482 RepID=UPI0021523D10|nr:ABC transporter permease [Clostridium sp. LY3-2]MCR6514278.1 ABC transporter permease [Clostridium sp. LY3-2]
MRIKSMVSRIIKQIINDKRTLALMLFAPLILLALMNFLFNSTSTKNPTLGVQNIDKNLVDTLKDNDIDIKEYKNHNDIKDKIKTDDLDAFVYMNDDTLKVTFENSDPLTSTEISAKIKGAVSKIKVEDIVSISKKQGEIIKKQAKALALLGNVNPEKPNLTKPSDITIDSSYIYGNENTTIFDTMIPVLIGFFVFFFVFLISGISLVKERTSGTLDKLLSTPIRRSEIVFGYLIGYGLFAILQTIIIVLFTVYVLKINIIGNLGLVFLTNIITAFVALSLGTLLSTFANSEFQMMQFIPIIIIPQIFFSGIIPVDTMHSGLQAFAKIMPIYYAGDALTNVVIKGSSLNIIGKDLIILLLFAIVFTILNIVGLKRYRKV